MTKYAIPIAITLAIAILALGVWIWSVFASMRFIESVTKFDIPFGTKVVDERYESTRLGSESLRISIYELDAEYADDITRKCESLGYSRLSRKQAGLQFPALEKYLVDNVPVCARKIRGEILAVSILQGKRVIIFVMV